MQLGLLYLTSLNKSSLQFLICRDYWIRIRKSNWKIWKCSKQVLCHQQTLPVPRTYCCDNKLIIIIKVNETNSFGSKHNSSNDKSILLRLPCITDPDNSLCVYKYDAYKVVMCNKVALIGVCPFKYNCVIHTKMGSKLV